jgi:hypothetical protein
LVIIFSFVAVSVSGASANLVPLLTDAHHSGTTAALAASAFGAAMIVGRVAGGFLLDSFFAPQVAAVLFVGAAGGEAILCARLGINVALVAAVLLGFVAGAEGDLMPLLVSRYFGMRSMAELYSYILGIFRIGNAAGRYLFAAGFDARHSNDVPLKLGCVALVISALISLALGKYPLQLRKTSFHKTEVGLVAKISGDGPGTSSLRAWTKLAPRSTLDSLSRDINDVWPIESGYANILRLHCHGNSPHSGPCSKIKNAKFLFTT